MEDAGIVDPVCPDGASAWNGQCVELIDDLESDTGFLPPIGGRDGAWYTYNDGTAGGMQSPVPWPAMAFAPGSTTPAFGNPVTGGMSAYSALTSGSGFTSWGAGMGFQFVLSSAQGVARSYDASAYKGIVFWAHGLPASPTVAVRVDLYDSNTINDGGVCGSPSECDPFGMEIQVTPAWSEYTMLFSGLAQESWGKQFPALEASALHNMNFQFSPSEVFAFEVDDIYFILK
jgi:hypothetical protein